MTTPSAAQFRAARALLDWSLVEAAKASRVSVSTLMTAEGRKPGRQIDGARSGIQSAFEAAGVIFTDDDGVKRSQDRFQSVSFTLD